MAAPEALGQEAPADPRQKPARRARVAEACCAGASCVDHLRARPLPEAVGVSRRWVSSSEGTGHRDPGAGQAARPPRALAPAVPRFSVAGDWPGARQTAVDPGFALCCPQILARKAKAMAQAGRMRIAPTGAGRLLHSAPPARALPRLRQEPLPSSQRRLLRWGVLASRAANPATAYQALARCQRRGASRAARPRRPSPYREYEWPPPADVFP